MSNQFELLEAARQRVQNETVPALLKAFKDKVEQIPTSNDQIAQVFVAPDALLDVAKWLKDWGFNMLVDVAGADYWPKREPRFEVIYHFRQLPGLGMIRVRVRVGEENPVVPSLTSIWSVADCTEREVYDQYGIKFKGHPNLKRVLNPDDWEGHPLRKDYPLRGPRALINLEMPADENTFAPFVDGEPSQEGK